VLPAGEYSIQLDVNGMPAVVYSTSTGKSANTNPPIVTDGQKGAAFLTITIRGNERRVRSVNLPRIGKSLVFERLTKKEREMFAKAGQIDTVPVITASK
jgi:formiminotetrahydrofolate cyclodeaminase